MKLQRGFVPVVSLLIFAVIAIVALVTIRSTYTGLNKHSGLQFRDIYGDEALELLESEIRESSKNWDSYDNGQFSLKLPQEMNEAMFVPEIYRSGSGSNRGVLYVDCDLMFFDGHDRPNGLLISSIEKGACWSEDRLKLLSSHEAGDSIEVSIYDIRSAEDMFTGGVLATTRVRNYLIAYIYDGLFIGSSYKFDLILSTFEFMED